MSELATPTSSGKTPSASREIKVVSHTSLVYWWPVWALGFIFGIWTWLEGDRMVFVLKGNNTQANANLQRTADKDGSAASDSQGYLVSRNWHLGLIFTIVLLFVVFSSQVTLRGVWSVFTILMLFVMIGVFALLGWLGPIIARLDNLRIYISATGYFTFATALFLLWVTTVFFFDRKRYVIFSPGQFIIRQDIGDAEQSHDSRGVTIKKRRNDFFRHRLLGLGAGDLVITSPSPAPGQQFEIPNVLFASRTYETVSELLRTTVIDRS